MMNYGHRTSLELQEPADVNFYSCGMKKVDFTVAAPIRCIFTVTSARRTSACNLNPISFYALDDNTCMQCKFNRVRRAQNMSWHQQIKRALKWLQNRGWIRFLLPRRKAEYFMARVLTGAGGGSNVNADSACRKLNRQVIHTYIYIYKSILALLYTWVQNKIFRTGASPATVAQAWFFPSRWPSPRHTPQSQPSHRSPVGSRSIPTPLASSV